jgi:ATP-binding protein involved in chromosome partitioning
MSYFLCPHCGGRTDIFSHGGGQKTSAELGVPFLGEVPIDAEVVAGGDGGTPIVAGKPDSPAARAYALVARRVAAGLARLALQEKGDSRSLFMEW